MLKGLTGAPECHAEEKDVFQQESLSVGSLARATKHGYDAATLAEDIFS